MSYGADWRLLEERVDDNLSLSAWTEGTWSPGTDLDRVQQSVWGTRYVDDIVLHRVDRNTDGDYSDPGDGTWHHLTDAQFSSVCLVTDAGIVAERVAYSAYGTARQLWREDINADGAVDSADLALLLAAFGSGVGGTQYRSEIDLNRDGVINIMDLGLLLGGYAPALAPGTLSSVLVDNPIGWDGYVFDRESGLYTVRFRTYETGLGRWLERDPAGYVDGASLQSYAASSPIVRRDAMGLHAESESERKARINAVGCDSGCCEVRVYASNAFGISGIFHLCIEIETPAQPGEQSDGDLQGRPEFDSDATCVTHRAELERWWEDYNGDNVPDESEIAPWSGPIGWPLGSFGSFSGDGRSGGSTRRTFGGDVRKAWGIRVDRRKCRRQEAQEASKVVPVDGSSRSQCQMAQCLRRAATEIAARASTSGSTYELFNNSNSYIGQVLRACGAKLEREEILRKAPGSGNDFYRGN